jgi:hypothetical protein
MAAPAAVYRPRNPQLSDYYRCVEDNFETFIQIYDEHFSRQYGFWRPYVEQVIYRYLDCGNLPERVCPCEMQRLRPRIPSGILLQKTSFLPIMPSEARG